MAIEEVDVAREDAPAWTKGWGSPTVLVDGVDVEGASSSSAEMCCRIYKDGAPSVARIRERLSHRNQTVPGPD